MDKQQEVLKRIVILIQQIAENVNDRAFDMEWVSKSTDEIDKMIDNLKH